MPSVLTISWRTLTSTSATEAESPTSCWAVALSCSPPSVCTTRRPVALVAPASVTSRCWPKPASSAWARLSSSIRFWAASTCWVNLSRPVTNSAVSIERLSSKLVAMVALRSLKLLVSRSSLPASCGTSEIRLVITPWSRLFRRAASLVPGLTLSILPLRSSYSSRRSLIDSD